MLFLSNQISSPAHPEFQVDAWRRRGRKNRCAWEDFRTTYLTSNGARHNMILGPRNFLIQQNWVIIVKVAVRSPACIDNAGVNAGTNQRKPPEQQGIPSPDSFLDYSYGSGVSQESPDFTN